MNVLILTPDAVGSTLLQRLITIYMNFHEFDRPVINLHELTNGLIKYYSPDFNREILGKPPSSEQWGYHQSLPEIIDLLRNADHYKTSRLASYHLRRRNDPDKDRIPFQQYLDDNFFVISCRRRNVFEHALSWGINKITKKLNVYSAQEKLESFGRLYAEPFDVDVETVITACEDYAQYLQWADSSFSIGSYFYYEDHLPEIERYVMNLPIFGGQPRVTWKDKFGLSFQNYNRYTYLSSDIGTLALENHASLQTLLLEDHSDKSSTQSRKMLACLPKSHLGFLVEHKHAFINADECIGRMVDLGIMITPLPIKKQTLLEKMKMIRNLKDCIDAYNRWAEKNAGIADPVDYDILFETAKQERQHWIPRLNQGPAPHDPLQIG